MKVATILNAHDYLDLVLDTLDSITTYVGDDILAVVNGKAKDFKLPVYKLEGYSQGTARAPYRNVALSLMYASDLYPDADWYCYMEWDALFCSNGFKKTLEQAEQQNIWMMGTNGRIDYAEMPLIEELLGEQFRSVYYMLGACLFFHKNYMKKLKEIDFFNKFLILCNGFTENVPKYQGYDISEHMYPTIARHYGGNIGVFSTYENGTWHGDYKSFPVRWKPDIEEVDYEKVNFVHPLKTMCDVRKNLAIKRKELKNAKS